MVKPLVAEAVDAAGLATAMFVPALRRQGYQVRYREFEGRHEVPPGVVREGLAWLLGPANRADPA